MRLLLCVILMVVPIYVTADCFGIFKKTVKHRDYANKIGMICVHKYEDSKKEVGTGSFFVEVGRGEKITDRLKLLGTKRKLLCVIFGYGTDFKPRKDANRELKRSIRMLTNWRLNSDTVVCGFDFMHTGSQNSIKLAMDYRTVVKRRVPFAAEIIGNITRQMYDLKVFESFENIQLIGFSLGCHVSGFVGRRIKSELGKDIPRIIALDPPRTFLRSNTKKLLRSDAKYIQAIYSSRLGLKNIDAHCKIILNDGITQPNCSYVEFIQQTFCNHNYLFTVYDRMASDNYDLLAFKNQTASENNQNVPDLIVGHFGTKNICGVFYASTKDFHKKYDLQENSNTLVDSVDPGFLVDSSELIEDSEEN